MKEFFGVGGFQRAAEGAWSWQHILFVSLMLITTIALAVWLGKKFKDKEQSSKNKVLIWSAILIDGFELIKIIVNCSIEGFAAMRTMLPLFLCSIQLITLPLAAFSKGRVKEAALDFVFIFGILGAILGTYGAGQNYACYPVLSFDNVVSGVTHCISGFSSLYIAVSGMASMKRKNIFITFAILCGTCIAAYVANVLVDYNYMFLMAGDGTPYDIVYNWVGGHRVLYPCAVVLLFLLYISAFYGIYYLLGRRKQEGAD